MLFGGNSYILYQPLTVHTGCKFELKMPKKRTATVSRTFSIYKSIKESGNEYYSKLMLGVVLYLWCTPDASKYPKKVYNKPCLIVA